ncbi:MAG TPA: S41 family peptidase [Acetobacteraceae bacterium]|nr:S41 family peptidase [Acetobacteraceae bacterium]
MRRALAFLFILVTGPGWAATQATDRFSTDMASAVFTTALEFIAPRALDPVTVQQLTLWGLRGVSTLDPALGANFAEGTVTLRRGEAVLFSRAAPAETSAEGWGTLASDLFNAAWTASPTLQAQGGQALVSSFFDEMFNHLDPYSRYVAPQAADVDRARRSGEGGAGLQLTQVRGRFVVQSVHADGPAAEAGIVPGDQVIAVDDQPTRGEDLDTVLGWITGVEGTDVTLTIRTRTGRVRKLDLERAVLPPETVFTSRVGDALVVRIAGFSSDTDQRFARDLERQLGRGGTASFKGLIIDLRGNRGGLLRQAVAATDLVLKSGIIATTAGRSPEAAHEWRATGNPMAPNRPVAVLVDGRSASAAEIMAGAIADQGRGVVVGSSTLGKGLVQTVTTLPDGGELFVSWSRVLAPAGWPIQGLGVLPQVCTSLGADKLAEQLSTLEKGTLALAKALERHRSARAPVPAAEVVEQRAACPAAEGRDADLTTARWLFAHPAAYTAALVPPPP